MTIVYRTPSTTPLLFGAIKKNTTLPEGRLVLTNKKPNCPLIGRRNSQRFVWECRTAQQQASWSFTKVPTHCMNWSLTEYTEVSRWAVTSGSLLLVHKPHYRGIAIKKGLTLWTQAAYQKQGLASLRTMKTIVQVVTPELDMELEATQTT